jgi:hypothetical protein
MEGVGALVLDLTTPDSHGVETFDKAIPGLVSRTCFDPN